MWETAEVRREEGLWTPLEDLPGRAARKGQVDRRPPSHARLPVVPGVIPVIGELTIMGLMLMTDKREFLDALKR